jgi:hypothetical protein
MKEKVTEIFTELQKDTPYIQSIYLWGSITTNEYVRGKSDIDAIAFVNESTDPSEKDRLNKIIEEKISGLKINFLYLSELNGGPSKTGLTKFIKPEVILYDFPAWVHVSGKKFLKEDFLSGQATLDQIIEVTLKEIRERFLPIPYEKDYIYFVKAVAKLLYFINQKTSPFKSFRYSDLIADSDKNNLKIAQIIFDLKKSDWDTKSINNKMAELVYFIVAQS